MNIKIIAVATAATYLLYGCGLKTYSSGILQMGPDTYSVSADDLNASTAKQAALGQAQAHCTSLGKELLVTNTKSFRDGARSVYDVTFLCLSKGDPQLARPIYSKEPDVVIEDKRR